MLRPIHLQPIYSSVAGKRAGERPVPKSRLGPLAPIPPPNPLGRHTAAVLRRYRSRRHGFRSPGRSLRRGRVRRRCGPPRRRSDFAVSSHAENLTQNAAAAPIQFVPAPTESPIPDRLPIESLEEAAVHEGSEPCGAPTSFWDHWAPTDEIIELLRQASPPGDDGMAR